MFVKVTRRAVIKDGLFAAIVAAFASGARARGAGADLPPLDPCTVFPHHSVPAAGWCNAWQKRG